MTSIKKIESIKSLLCINLGWIKVYIKKYFFLNFQALHRYIVIITCMKGIIFLINTASALLKVSYQFFYHKLTKHHYKTFYSQRNGWYRQTPTQTVRWNTSFKPRFLFRNHDKTKTNTQNTVNIALVHNITQSRSWTVVFSF